MVVDDGARGSELGSALLDWANRSDLRLHQLNARPATLQEAFLTVAESGGNSDRERVP